MKKLAIIGASGQGKVAADIALKCGYNDIEFYDDSKEITECAGFKVIGKTIDAINLDCDKFVAIGNPEVREKIQNTLTNVVTLIHPDAVISRRVKIGEGTVIMAGSVINSDTEIGRGCIINTCSSVDHDNKIGDFVHVSVGAHIAGTCNIGNGSWIGAGSIVSNNINVCKDCMIGAGAVVVKDIEIPGTYIGVPATRKQ